MLPPVAAGWMFDGVASAERMRVEVLAHVGPLQHRQGLERLRVGQIARVDPGAGVPLPVVVALGHGEPDQVGGAGLLEPA